MNIKTNLIKFLTFINITLFIAITNSSSELKLINFYDTKHILSSNQNNPLPTTGTSTLMSDNNGKTKLKENYNVIDVLHYEPQYRVLDIATGNQLEIQKIIANYISDDWSLKQILDSNRGLKYLSFSPNSSYLELSAFYDNKTIKIWDLKNNKSDEYDYKKILPNDNPIFSPCGKYLASKTMLGLSLQRIEDHKEFILPIDLKHMDRIELVLEILFFKDSKRLLASIRSNQVKGGSNYHEDDICVWNIENLEKISVEKLIRTRVNDLHKFGVNNLSFSPCEQFLAFSDGSTLKILNLKTDKINAFNDLNENDSEDEDLESDDGVGPDLNDISSIVFTKCGKFLISTDFTGTIKIWQIDTLKCLYHLKHNNEQNYGGHRVYLAISPCGQYLASGSDSEIRIWQNDGSKILENIGLPTTDSADQF